MREECYVQMGVSASRYNMDEFIRGTTQNTLLLYGENELFVRPDRATTIVKGFKNPNLSLHIIKESGHNPAYEQPQQTAKVIERFLMA